MLLGEEQLKTIGATLYHIDRGGDITYHGPGQLVCYPILNLEEFGLGLKEYVHLLEEAVIRVCASYGVVAGRLEKATGVWLEGDTSRARKICAIGVRSSHYVTMHGLALNVNTDLRYFSYAPACKRADVHKKLYGSRNSPRSASHGQGHRTIPSGGSMPQNME